MKKLEATAGSAPKVASPSQRRRRTTDKHEDRLTTILLVSAQLFAERGYDATSLDTIADRLDMHKATLYHYVDGKESILYQCLIRSFGDLEEVVEQMSDRSTPALERLRIFARHLAHAQNSEFGRCLVLVGSQPLDRAPGGEIRKFQRRLDSTVRALLEEGMSDGTIKPTDPALASALLFGALNWVPRWYKESGKLAIDHIVDTFMNIFTGGVAAQPAPTKRAARASRAG
ncbi:transcriptional regulator, TetR family [Burkholderia sp. D7]|jgi:AcrR family transcriptional regulator|nr:transcriptional regulator, TetR family [Burkholderia sp. D7]